MLLSGTGCVFVTLLLSAVSGILGEAKQMCVLKGSSVDLPCSGHIENTPESQSIQRINEVRQSDTNTYQCTATDSNDISHFSLHVTDLQVTVILGPLREGQGVILNCNTSCPLTDRHTYMWYKNGQFLYEDSSPWYQLPVNSEDEVNYSCAVKGHEALKAPDVSVNSVDPKCFKFRMTYTDGRMCPKSMVNNPCSITYFRDLKVEEEKSKTVTRNTVKLTCSTSCIDPKNTFLWYRNRDYNGTGQQYNDNRASIDSYYCVVRGQEDIRSHSVCVPGKSCWRVNYMKQTICALIGSSVNISCMFSYPAGHQLEDAYWFTSSDLSKPIKLIEEPSYEGRLEFGRKLQNPSILTVKNLTESDSAEYKFRFHTNKDKYGGTYGVNIYVTALKLKITPAADATEGQRVTLVCSSSCPLTDSPTYMWYHNSVTQNQSQQNYVVLDPVSSQHAGEYSCAVKGHEELRSPEETLTVTPAKNAAIVVITVVGLSLIILVLACLWIRKKRSQTSSTEPAQSRQTKPDPMYDNISAVSRTLVTAPHGPTEPQDELHYSSVHFPPNSNSQPPQRQDVQYAAVNFKTSSK